MSIVTYNGVQLPYPVTSSFQQEAVFDETGTDHLYNRFDLTVQSLVNPAYLSQLAPDLLNNVNLGMAPAPTVEIMNAIRVRLLTPRRLLSVKVKDTELIPSQTMVNPTVPGAVDAKNGPLPQSCNIQQLTNTTFLITFRITAHYVETQRTQASTNGQVVFDTSESTNAVISNRWTESVELDSSLYSKRTRNGKFVIRSDNVQGQIADELRSAMAVVGVPDGFVRVVSNYNQSPDGLSISYTIVDKEVYRLPPRPAFEASGSYTESATFKGPLRTAEMSLKLRGHKFVSQDRLVEAAVGIASAKLANLGTGVAINGVSRVRLPESMTLTLGLFDNTVEVRLRALLKPFNQNRFGRVWGIDYRNLTEMPGDLGQPTYFDRGTASVLLQAAAYWDPTLANRLNRAVGQNQEGTPPGLGAYLGGGGMTP